VGKQVEQQTNNVASLLYIFISTSLFLGSHQSSL